MYCLVKLCRICVSEEENMKSIYSLDTDQVSFYNKLLSCVPELKSEKLYKEIYLCISCCNNIANLYTFRNNCVKNKNLFEGYVQQLSHGIHQKQAKLTNKLNKYDYNKPKDTSKFIMTYNEDISTMQENFYFDMSTSDEFRLDNCTHVYTSPTDEVDLNKNIQDLSQAVSFNTSSIFDTRTHCDNNTDGELTNMIECFNAETINEDTTISEVISIEKSDSRHNFDSEIDNVQELNIQTANIIIANNCNNFGQIQFLNGDSNKTQQNLVTDTDIKILDSSSCNFQILNLIQNTDVQYLVHSNDIQQIPNTVRNTSIFNVIPSLEKTDAIKTIMKTDNKTVIQLPPAKKPKMTNEEIEENVAKKVKTIMESIANNSENNKKIETILSKSTNSEEKTEKSKEPIKCEQCGNMYKDQASLRKHKYIVHEAQASFKCDFCGKAFKTSYRCRYHMKLHLTNQKGPNLCKCEFCGEVFANITSFETHARSHKEHVSLLCVLCEEKCQTAQDFECHMKSHLGSAMYKCQTCDLEFEKFNEMRSHQRTHTGQQLFHCSICNKNYCNRNSLNRHMIRMHENVSSCS